MLEATGQKGSKWLVSVEPLLIRCPVPGSSFDIEPSRAEAEGEEEDARRDQRSKDQRSATRSAPKQHSMLPLLESTPLKARRQGTVECGSGGERY